MQLLLAGLLEIGYGNTIARAGLLQIEKAYKKEAWKYTFRVSELFIIQLCFI
jgi:hypothetical protein